MSGKKKNIILIMSDQHAATAAGFLGNRQVKTPNLDRLAEDSCVFTNTYCPAPICGPSRFAFLTGQHVHRCGSYDNGSSVCYDEPTLGHLMINAGYRSILCGRMHIHGPDQFVGFEERPISGWINPIHGYPASMLPRDHGYSEFEGYVDGTTYDNLQVDELSLIEIDDYTIEKACEIIRTHETVDERPLFMVIGLYGPHPSTSHRKEYHDLIKMYNEMDLDVYEFTADDLQKEGDYNRNRVLGNGLLPDREYNCRMLAEYYARITYTDNLIGKVLDTMQDSGSFDDSYLIYTSDHGEMMGDKGTWGKVAMNENSTRIPLTVKLPEQKNKQLFDCPTSLVDIFPTLAEITRSEVPYELSGKSLLPLIERNDDGDSRIAISQYHGKYTTGSAFMLRSGKYKYNYYNHSQTELYDLESDPGETDNLAGKAEFTGIVKEFHQQLLDELGMSPVDIETVIRANQSKRLFIIDAVRNSETVKKRLKQTIREFRDDYDDPWWDGGEYMLRYEKQFQE